MTEVMLLKSKHGVLRLYKGWVDFAARKSEHVEKHILVTRWDKPTQKYVKVACVEKNSETLAAFLKRFGDLIVLSHTANRLVSISEYLKIRAERKAKKEAQAAEAAAAGSKPGLKMFWVKVDGSIMGPLSHLLVADSADAALAQFKKKHPDEKVLGVELAPNPFTKGVAQS